MASIQDYQAREHLLNALKEREIPIGAEDISWAFASPETREEIINWVKEYLHDNNLLTKEELDFASKAGSSIGESPDSTVIVHDQQLKTAIESLEASAAQIEKHAAALEKQRDILMAVRQLDGHASNQASGQLEMNLAQELTKLNFDVEESLLSVEEAYSTLDKQNSRAVSSLNSTVSDRLEADDQVFNAMSKLALRTKPPPPQTIDPKTVENWCNTLSRLRESEATARVDTAIQNYICEMLLSDQNDFHNTHSTEQEADLATEISCLRSEIGAIVEMVVASQLKKPILNLASSSRQRAVLAQHEWLCYVLATLEHMINHLHTLGTCTDDLTAYTRAFGEVAEAWRMLDELEGNQTDAKNTSNGRSSTARPARARTNSAVAGQAASASPSADITALVFRRFSITAPSSSSAPSLEALAAAAAAADSKLRAQYATATSATGELVGKALDRQRRDWQNVSRPIYGFSDHATVRLMPTKLEESIKELDSEIEQTAKALEGMERSS